jgi:hypothetical protein
VSEARNQLSKDRRACAKSACEQPRVPDSDYCEPCRQVVRAEAAVHVAKISRILRGLPELSTFRPAPVQDWEKQPS